MITGAQKADFVQRFFPGTGSTYDQIVRLCTLGFDRRWKKRMLAAIPKGSQFILDQACGTGIFTLMVARRFPQARIIGLDLTEDYLRQAQEKVRRLGINNVTFVPGKAEEVRPDGGFDCITSSYLAKYADLERLIPNIKTMLHPGGFLIMHDFTYPPNPAFALLWELYFKLLQNLGTYKYPSWKTVFRDLPGLLRETQWVDDLLDSLRKNGFSNISIQSFTFGTAALITARKP